MIIAMMMYPIDGNLHETHCNGFYGHNSHHIVFKALNCTAVVWGYSISGSYLLGVPLSSPKFFMEPFKLHSDVKVFLSDVVVYRVGSKFVIGKHKLV